MPSLFFLIPARGGSKGFPGKNTKTLGGIPLVGRAVRLGHAAGELIGESYQVVCSTDDEAIAEAARIWGAQLPFMRPAELASDTASSVDVVMHALRALKDENVNRVVMLQPTSPLTDPMDVVEAVHVSLKTGESVVSVCPVEHPSDWQLLLDSSGRLLAVSPGMKKILRRQDAGSRFRLNGAIYVAHPSQIVKNKGFLGSQTRAYVMPAERSVDIDTPLDLDIACAILGQQAIEPVRIGERLVGPGQPCFVIAEAGVNHNGDIQLAKKLIDVAAEAKADAIKFQIFDTEKIVSFAAPKAGYQRHNASQDQSQYDMLKGLELSAEQHRELAEYCKEKKILYLASPFDEQSLNILVKMGVQAIKVGSGELTNHRFLRQIVASGLPVLMSTGMASMREVDQSMRVVTKTDGPPVILLHCVSAYPCPVEQSNLAAMQSLQLSFRCPTGWSDHSLGIHVALAAVVQGAHVLEKHLTLDRKMPGPDHAASIEPDELKKMIRLIREIEVAIGDNDKNPQPCELDARRIVRRSVHAARDIAAGQTVGMEDLQMLRPGTGLPAERVDNIVGKKSTRAISQGEILAETDFA